MKPTLLKVEAGPFIALFHRKSNQSEGADENSCSHLGAWSGCTWGRGPDWPGRIPHIQRNWKRATHKSRNKTRLVKSEGYPPFSESPLPPQKSHSNALSVGWGGGQGGGRGNSFGGALSLLNTE